MLSDPQSITIATVAQSLARTKSGDLSSTYRKVDGAHELIITHTVKNRNRHNFRLVSKIIAPDPLTAVNTSYTSTISFTIDKPAVGFTNQQILDNALGFISLLSLVVALCMPFCLPSLLHSTCNLSHFTSVIACHLLSVS